MHHCSTAGVKILDLFPFYLILQVLFHSPVYRNSLLYKIFVLDLHHINMSILNLIEVFWNIFIWLMDHHWTIPSQGLMPWDHHGHWWAPWECHDHRCTALESHYVYVFLFNGIKNYNGYFCGTSAGIRVFPWEKTAVNLNFREKFYENGASVVLRRRMAISTELPAM